MKRTFYAAVWVGSSALLALVLILWPTTRTESFAASLTTPTWGCDVFSYDGTVGLMVYTADVSTTSLNFERRNGSHQAASTAPKLPFLPVGYEAMGSPPPWHVFVTTHGFIGLLAAATTIMGVLAWSRRRPAKDALACQNCGYDLNGTVCPECGAVQGTEHAPAAADA